MKELSVIVPVYNVEKYLVKCLDSLVSQSIRDYEIIIINDGSTDDSQNIIDIYERKYSDIIKSYIKENGGLSDARNFGIRHANGKYITFLDSDDYVDNNLYRGMLDIANSNDSDLVVGDIEYFWQDDNKTLVKEGLHEISENNIKNLFLSPLFAWNKIYKKELFDKLDLQYPVGLWYEDIPVSLKVFSSIKSVGYYNHPGYHYRQRSSSIMGSKNDPRLIDIFTEFKNIVNDFKIRNKFEEFYDELEYLFIEHFLIYGAYRFLRSNDYKKLMNKAFKFVSDYFPNYRDNKYIKTLGKKDRFFLKTNNSFTKFFYHWYFTK